MKLSAAIKKRRSVRRFTGEPFPEETLSGLLEQPGCQGLGIRPSGRWHHCPAEKPAQPPRRPLQEITRNLD
ncbi:MAG: hypothetical protein GX334_06655 [Firmicutes bacterium]|nr:hypothetical protein [Bacillota bacterium]